MIQSDKLLFMKSSIKCFLVVLLVLFGFSLQSFNGYRIEKRHYRKGYYIHICHAPKNKPVHIENIPIVDEPIKSTLPTKTATPEKIEEQNSDTPSRRIDYEQKQSNAPVSEAPIVEKN